jgi:hypothetical protein
MRWCAGPHVGVMTIELDLISLAAPEPPPRRGRRLGRVGGAAVVLSVLGGGLYQAGHRHSGRVISGSRTKTLAAGGQPLSPRSALKASLDGMALLLPKDLPAEYRLQTATAAPPGAIPTSPTLSYTAAFGGSTVADFVVITANGGRGSIGGPPTTMPDQLGNDQRTVHGVSATSSSGWDRRTLEWIEHDTSYYVQASLSVPESVLMATAESVRATDEGPVFTVAAPAGFTETFAGDFNELAPWSLMLLYGREDLDQPEDATISVTVSPVTPTNRSLLNPVTQALAVGGLIPPDVTMVKVQGRDAYLSSGGSYPLGFTSLNWETVDGLAVFASATGLSESDVLGFADSLAPVEESAFRTAAGKHLAVYSDDTSQDPGFYGRAPMPAATPIAAPPSTVPPAPAARPVPAPAPPAPPTLPSAEARTASTAAKTSIPSPPSPLPVSMGSMPVPLVNADTLAVIASGTFADHTWQLRNQPGSASTGIASNWYFSFAVGPAQFLPSYEVVAPAGFVRVAIAELRRRFVVAEVKSDVTNVKATMSDGRAVNVAPFDAQGTRLVVLPVNLDQTLTSLRCEGANFVALDVLVNGDPSLPSSLGPSLLPSASPASPTDSPTTTLFVSPFATPAPAVTPSK